MDHVRTQLPYAIAVAAVSVPIGDVATAYGLPAWVALLLCAGLLLAFLRWRGRPLATAS
jgi:Na+/H+ antiporter NhaC